MFLKIKFLKKRLLAIKFLTQNVPEKTLLPIALLDKFGFHCSYVQMVPMYKWFPCTNGSQVQMVSMYKWFPGTNGSYVQMVPMYIWLPGTNGSHASQCGKSPKKRHFSRCFL
jgi:hypothetical protein